MQGRWFQYRLRTLLALVVLLCVLLGSWQLYWTYFGPYVAAEPAMVGQPINVRGRFFDFRGPETTAFTVKLSRPMADGRPVIHQSGGGYVKRRGLWAYDVEIELRPIGKPGEYDVELLPMTKAVMAASRGKSRTAVDRVRTVVRGKARILAGDLPAQPVQQD